MFQFQSVIRTSFDPFIFPRPDHTPIPSSSRIWSHPLYNFCLQHSVPSYPYFYLGDTVWTFCLHFLDLAIDIGFATRTLCVYVDVDDETSPDCLNCFALYCGQTLFRTSFCFVTKGSICFSLSERSCRDNLLFVTTYFSVLDAYTSTLLFLVAVYFWMFSP